MWTVVGTLLFMSIFMVPSILAHSATLHPEDTILRKTLYAIYVIYIVFLASTGYMVALRNPDASWFGSVSVGLSALAFLFLFRPFRSVLSKILTPLNKLAAFDFFRKKGSSTEQAAASPEPAFRDATMLSQVFLPDSLPHLNGLVLYLLALAVTLQRLQLGGFSAPALASAPEARSIDFAVCADFFSTLLVVAVGIGLLIRRNPREVLFRLSLVKPGAKEACLGVLLCGFTFFYDYVWSLFTHTPNSPLPAVMRDFNVGSYSAHGDLGSVLLLSIGIALVAGLEEEITNRGALQPALGIVPAAFMHAALHTQFNAAPLFMVQIFGWSMLMGTAKYYTNTTTTIIAHGLFNLISCFLIGFNP